MHIIVLTLFPEMIRAGLGDSIIGRAVKAGTVTIEAMNIRDYAMNKHNSVDDYTYGGGAGMLMQAEPVYRAIVAAKERIAELQAGERTTAGQMHSDQMPDTQTTAGQTIAAMPDGIAGHTIAAMPDGAAGHTITAMPDGNAGDAGDTGNAGGAHARVIYMSPQGPVLTQARAEELAKEENLIFLCGHYEGIDERVLEECVDEYISIGDYVLTGGELPAMVTIDALARFVPGVLHNHESTDFESLQGNLLEYPQYSRPEIWHGKKVPEVLMSGHHANVERWRREQSILRTAAARPDLLEKAELTKKEKQFLEQARQLQKAELNKTNADASETE